MAQRNLDSVDHLDMDDTTLWLLSTIACTLDWFVHSPEAVPAMEESTQHFLDSTTFLVFGATTRSSISRLQDPSSHYHDRSDSIPLLFMFGWQWVGILRHYDHTQRHGTVYGTVDDDIKELAHSPRNVRADLWRTHHWRTATWPVSSARVDTFTSHQRNVQKLPSPQMGMENVGPLESEVNMRNALVWTVNGGTHLGEQIPRQWKRYQEVRLPSTLSSYMTRPTTLYTWLKFKLKTRPWKLVTLFLNLNE